MCPPLQAMVHMEVIKQLAGGVGALLPPYGSQDQIGIIRLASKHLYPWAISMAPFVILLSMYINLCTSGAYVYHYYIHTMAQDEARGQLLGGSSLLSPC